MGEYKNNLDDAFAAMADGTRRAIVQQLLEGPARVTELAAPHPISLNSVSKHLRILERAKLVQREVRGREHWFTFHDEPMRDVDDWVGATLNFWARQVDSLEQFLASDDSEP